jgi:glucosamine kinase
MVEFEIGIDGGGTGTRAVLARTGGDVIGRGVGGPSALGQGIASAWEQLIIAIRAAFANAGLAVAPWSSCVVGAGLSGVSHKPFRDDFLARNPGFLKLVVETDSYAMLLGAHDGEPGAVVIAGTGSIGEALLADGSRVRVGGWGFPIGDEGSGAWLGWRAMQIAHRAMDNLLPKGALVNSIYQRCGSDRQALQAWCKSAGQYEFAQLALIVFECESADVAAAKLLSEAVDAIAAIAKSLDTTETLPVAVCGSIGQRLMPRLMALQQRAVAPTHDAAVGALNLIRTTTLVTI